MAEFNSDADKKKWKSLQNNAGVSLAAIASGKANSADIQRVRTALNGLSSLAAMTFDEAVSAAEVQAKKFQTQLEKLEGLTSDQAFEKALGQALSAVAPDLVKQIEDALSLELLQHNEDLSRTMGSRFDQFEDLLPKKGEQVTGDDLLAAASIAAEESARLIDQQWAQRESGFIAKISDAFRITLRDFVRDVSAARRQGGVSRVPQLGYAGGGTLVDTASRFAPARDANVVDVQARAVGSPTALPSPSGVQPRDGVAVSMTKSTEDAIMSAAAQQTALYQKLLDFLQHPQDSKAAGDDDEEKKADTWWRSFRGWMGDKYDSAKKAMRDNKSWLSALGTALLTMVTAPELYESIGQIITKYLTWENVKSAVLSAWDYLKEKGQAVIDWIMDKLGLSKKDKGDEKKSSTSAPTADTYRQDAAQGHMPGTSAQAMGIQPVTSSATAPVTAPTPGAMTPVPGSNGAPGANGAPGIAGMAVPGSAASTVNVANSLVSGPNAGMAVTANGTFAVNTTNSGGKSYLTQGGMFQAPGQSNTVSQTDKPVSITPGATTPPPLPANSGQDGIGTGDNRPMKGTAQVGITSFGFTAGIDDSLVMMNSRYFSGG